MLTSCVFSFVSLNASIVISVFDYPTMAKTVSSLHVWCGVCVRRAVLQPDLGQRDVLARHGGRHGGLPVLSGLHQQIRPGRSVYWRKPPPSVTLTRGRSFLSKRQDLEKWRAGEWANSRKRMTEKQGTARKNTKCSSHINVCKVKVT